MDYPTLSNGRYLIEQCIGTGGMAAVFKCFDQNLKVFRAVKVLRPEMLARGNIRARFATEAQAMASLQHPNIVHVYDHGADESVLFIVMEYLPHNSLQYYLDQRGPLSGAQAVAVCTDVAHALQRAHEQGIIHRDIKPDNILLSPAGAKISDFGLARITSDEQRVTKTKAVMGSFPFMAPEQRLSAKKTTHQSDIYALTASLFVMLTNEDPSDLFDPEERPQLLAPIEASLAAIISKGCESALDARYADVSTLLVDLQEAGRHTRPEDSSLDLPENDEEIGRTEKDLTQLRSVWSQYTSGSTESLHEEKDRSKETIHFQNEGSVVSEGSIEPLPERPDTSVVESTAPNLRSLFIAGTALFLLIVAAVTWLPGLAGDPEEEGSSGTITYAGEIKPPDWNYGGLLLLTTPSSESDQANFIAARRAMLNGNYPLAERLLSPVMEAYPEDPAVYSLSAIIHFLRGRDGLSAEASQKAATWSRDLDSSLGAFLQLANRSWRELENGPVLMQKWDALRAQQTDPFVEIGYLVSARFLLGSKGFLEGIRQARKIHPDWVVLASMEIYALQEIRSDAEAIQVVQEALALFPTASGLLLKKGEIAFRLGDLEVAEEDLKQVLMLDGNLTEARALLAGIYLQRNMEEERVEQVMIGLGDTTPPFDRLVFLQEHASQLANKGRLNDAEAHWKVCLETAREAGDNNRILECASSALDALDWLKPVEEWETWIERLRSALSQPGFDESLRKFYTIRLISAEATRDARQGQFVEATARKEQLESMAASELPFDTQELFGREIAFELALAEEDRKALDSLFEEYRAKAGADSPSWCMGFFRHARASRALQDRARLEEALQQIKVGSCVHNSNNQGMMLAKIRLWRAEMLIEEGQIDDAREPLEAFRQAWPTADPELGTMRLAESLEGRL
jgi:serine/threonine protein kinase/tetratricopeptide (TPR) repeat protein